MDGAPHILVISQYFYPEPFRISDMAAEWVKRGYKVTVLTGIPNYPEGVFYEGYDLRRRRRETWNGVEIIRIPLAARGHGAVRLAANYLSFVLSGWSWVRRHDVHADIVFTFEVSPMTQALIGVWYGKRYHVPTLLYVQDLWPENVEIVTGIRSRAIIGPIDRMVDRIYRETDQILTTSPSFVEAIVGRRKAVDPGKVHFWPQYAEEFYRPMERIASSDIPGLAAVMECRDYKIAFTGNIGNAQGLDILPKTAELLRDAPVRFVIVGDGRYRAKLEEEIEARGVRDKFFLIGRQPAERIPEILSVCDAGFISFSKTKLWEMTIPAKLQSYLACGKMVIASASGETKRIVEEAGCGICTEIGDPAALAAGIRSVMHADPSVMGARARQYFENNFDKKKLMDELCEKYLPEIRRPGRAEEPSESGRT